MTEVTIIVSSTVVFQTQGSCAFSVVMGISVTVKGNGTEVKVGKSTIRYYTLGKKGQKANYESNSSNNSHDNNSL